MENGDRNMLTYYLLCAKGAHGGPEALHQIARKMLDLGYDARIVLYQNYRDPEKRFREYEVPYVRIRDIPDSRDTVLCVTETNSYYLRRFREARKIMIWLSLDYYLMRREEESYSYRERCRKVYINSRFRTRLAYPFLYLREILLNRRYRFDIPDVRHTYNCEYVRAYLSENGIDSGSMVFLDGPLRKEFFDELQPEKKDMMAYNPGKGAEQLSGKLEGMMQEKYPSLKCTAIRGMSPEEVKDTLLRAKVYVDLGSFPGPEKLVKEACMCRCNIITARRGAAANDRDVPIPEGYKFDADESCLPEIMTLAHDMMINYPLYNDDFSAYRDMIVSLEHGFEDTVRSFASFAAEE